MPTKPSIVFCHGIWADGSSLSKVIPPLQSEGYEVMAAQYGLDTPEGDVATVKRTLGRICGDPSKAKRTWVLLTGAAEGGWGIGGTAFGREEFAALAAAKK